MTDAGTSPHPIGSPPGRRRRTGVKRQGLALRFALIIGDRRLAGALHVSCHLDTVVVDFPETSVHIGLSPLPGKVDAGIVLDCRVEYRPGTEASHRATRAEWQQVLMGGLGSCTSGRRCCGRCWRRGAGRPTGSSSARRWPRCATWRQRCERRAPSHAAVALRSGQSSEGLAKRVTPGTARHSRLDAATTTPPAMSVPVMPIRPTMGPTSAYPTGSRA